MLRDERRRERERYHVLFDFGSTWKDVEGVDSLQTRAFPVEGHVGYFWLLENFL